jgi:hypothetical protein
VGKVAVNLVMMDRNSRLSSTSNFVFVDVAVSGMSLIVININTNRVPRGVSHYSTMNVINININRVNKGVSHYFTMHGINSNRYTSPSSPLPFLFSVKERISLLWFEVEVF